MSKVTKKTRSEDIDFEFPDVKKKNQTKKNNAKIERSFRKRENSDRGAAFRKTYTNLKNVASEKKKITKALWVIFGVVIVAVVVYVLLDAIVKSMNAPIFSVEVEAATVCPNGKVLDFDYRVEDKKGNDITESSKVEFKWGKVYISATDERGFYGEKAIKANIEDKDAPEIELNGDDEVSIIINDEYKDFGATAIDKCDGEISVSSDGVVDNNKIGEYEIVYRATDESGNVSEAKRIVKVTEPVGVIYLTFDDGPSDETDRLLDVLKKYDVKVTFFVTGRGDDEVIKREYDEGHAIGLHTYSHYYPYIYQNEDVFFDDLYAIRDRVKDITGYESNLMRFPGGSSNTVSALYDDGAHIMSKLVDSVTEKGFSYFDWNISSGDAGGAETAEDVYNNVVDNLGEGNMIVLQHDTAGFSIDAVENIIKYGKSHGYRFKKLEPDSYGAHHWVRN